MLNPVSLEALVLDVVLSVSRLMRVTPETLIDDSPTQGVLKLDLMDPDVLLAGSSSLTLLELDGLLTCKILSGISKLSPLDLGVSSIDCKFSRLDDCGCIRSGRFAATLDPDG